MPGPAIGFLQESLRWFDHWMRGKDTGVERDPKLIAWMPQAVPAKNFYAESPGRWVARSAMAFAAHQAAALVPERGRRAGRRGRDGERKRRRGSRRRRSASRAASSCRGSSTAPSPELPGDQRPDDGQSLCFDTAPLDEGPRDPRHACGRPRALGRPAGRFRLRAPVRRRARRRIDARHLRDVQSHAHRGADKVDSPRAGPALQGARPLIDCAYSFAKGHRMRVAVSTTYWPLIWPSPEPVTLTLATGKSALALPVRPPSPRTRTRRGSRRPNRRRRSRGPRSRREAAIARSAPISAKARPSSKSPIRAAATATTKSTWSRKRARPSATA